MKHALQCSLGRNNNLVVELSQGFEASSPSTFNTAMEAQWV